MGDQAPTQSASVLFGGSADDTPQPAVNTGEAQRTETDSVAQTAPANVGEAHFASELFGSAPGTSTTEEAGAPAPSDMHSTAMPAAALFQIEPGAAEEEQHKMQQPVDTAAGPNAPAQAESAAVLFGEEPAREDDAGPKPGLPHAEKQTADLGAASNAQDAPPVSIGGFDEVDVPLGAVTAASGRSETTDDDTTQHEEHATDTAPYDEDKTEDAEAITARAGDVGQGEGSQEPSEKEEVESKEGAAAETEKKEDVPSNQPAEQQQQQQWEQQQQGEEKEDKKEEEDKRQVVVVEGVAENEPETAARDAPASSMQTEPPATATQATPPTSQQQTTASAGAGGVDQQDLLMKTQLMFQQQMEEMRRMTMSAMEAMAAKQAEAATKSTPTRAAAGDEDEDEDEDEPPPDPEDDMDNWRKQQNKKGRVYFYNVVTRRSQWKRPACWVSPPPSEEEEEEEEVVEEEVEGARVAGAEEDEVVKKGSKKGSKKDGRRKSKVAAPKKGKRAGKATDDEEEEEDKKKRASSSSSSSSVSSAAESDADERKARGRRKDKKKKKKEETKDAAEPEASCPHCGAANTATAKFCCECGRSLREIPKLCQMEGCRSFGSAKQVVYSSNDDMLTRRNNGRTMYLCYRCGEMIKAFPLFENVDMVQIAELPGDVDDGRSVISSFSQLQDLQANMHSLHTSFRGPATTIGAGQGDRTQSFAHHQHHHGHAPSAAMLESASARPQHEMEQGEGFPHGMRGPPGKYIGDSPDMTDPVNIQWYEMEDIPPEDPRWGTLLPDEEGDVSLGEDNALSREGEMDGDEAAAAEEEREPTPEPVPVRPIFPLVSFGFGGRILTVFPHYERPHEEGGEDHGAGEAQGADSNDEWTSELDVAPGDSVSCQASEHGSDGGAGGEENEEEGADEEQGPKPLGCSIVVHSLGDLLAEGGEDDSAAAVVEADKRQEEVHEEAQEREEEEGPRVGSAEDGEEEHDDAEAPEKNVAGDGAQQRKSRRAQRWEAAAAAAAREARADVLLLQQGDVSQCVLAGHGLSAAGVSQLVHGLSPWLKKMGFAPSKAVLCRLLAVLCRHGFPQPPTAEGVLSLTSGLLDQISALLQDVHEETSNVHHSDVSGARDTGAEHSVEDSGGVELSAAERQQHMRRIQALLLAGQREAACKAALEAGLWEHALILGWYTGPEMHKRVVTKVADKRFSPSHPLGVLYHAFAGHVPAAPPAAPPLYEDVDRWADTLLAFVNNPTRDASHVVSHLARSLVAKGNTDAHDLCRLLLGQLPSALPPHYQQHYQQHHHHHQQQPEMMLLGRNHRSGASRTTAFANAVAVKLTEIALFAAMQSSGLHALQLVPGFHVYLYWMAAHASECGQPAVALSYCEAIASMLAQCTAEHCHMLHVSPQFLSAVISLALRLLASSPECADQSVMTSFWTQTGPQLLASLRPAHAAQQQQQQHDVATEGAGAGVQQATTELGPAAEQQQQQQQQYPEHGTAPVEPSVVDSADTGDEPGDARRSYDASGSDGAAGMGVQAWAADAGMPEHKYAPHNVPQGDASPFAFGEDGGQVGMTHEADFGGGHVEGHMAVSPLGPSSPVPPGAGESSPRREWGHDHADGAAAAQEAAPPVQGRAAEDVGEGEVADTQPRLGFSAAGAQMPTDPFSSAQRSHNQQQSPAHHEQHEEQQQQQQRPTTLLTQQPHTRSSAGSQQSSTAHSRVESPALTDPLSFSASAHGFSSLSQPHVQAHAQQQAASPFGFQQVEGGPLPVESHHHHHQQPPLPQQQQQQQQWQPPQQESAPSAGGSGPQSPDTRDSGMPAGKATPASNDRPEDHEEEEGNAAEEAEREQHQKQKKKEEEGGGGDGQGGRGLFGFLFGSSKPKVPTAHLDDGDSKLEYDKEHKAWLPIDPEERKKALEEMNKKVAPPPTDVHVPKAQKHHTAEDDAAGQAASGQRQQQQQQPGQGPRAGSRSSAGRQKRRARRSYLATPGLSPRNGAQPKSNPAPPMPGMDANTSTQAPPNFFVPQQPADDSQPSS